MSSPIDEDSPTSSPTPNGLKRSAAMEFDHICETATLATLKSEDSGIVLANGLQSPEDEIKDIVANGTSKADASSKQAVTGDRKSRRRRSSAGTYSSAEDDDDDEETNVATSEVASKRKRDSGINGVWLSDDEHANDAVAMYTEPDQPSVIAMYSEPDQPSVVCGLVEDDGAQQGSTPEQDDREQTKVERPKVDFKMGITCTDVIHAIEILLTHYRLPDVNPRDHHKSRSIWGSSDYSSRSSYLRVRHPNDLETGGSAKLKEISLAIERRHVDIAGIVAKLIELEAANRAEAEALVRLASIPKGSEGELSAAKVEPGHAAEAVNALQGEEEPEAGEPNAGTDQPGLSRKRRNPFTRAVHALRKRFARPQSTVDQPAPVAA